tara:strand:- start:147 stop:593 length:447 start_codon:yes stop_codon:yes gene_type:complete
MFESLFKLIDPAKFGFKDKCFNDIQRPLGFLCGLYVFIIITYILSIITGMIVLFRENNCDELDTTKKMKVVLFSVIIILWQLFVIIFMINACNMCNGFYAFIVLFIIGVIGHFIANLLFGNVYKDMTDCTKKQLRQMMEQQETDDEDD